MGPSRKPLDVKVIIGGKGRTLELGDAIGRAGNALIDKIYPALTTLIERASSDSVVTLLQNIIVTGGGSQIRSAANAIVKAAAIARPAPIPDARLATCLSIPRYRKDLSFRDANAGKVTQLA